MLTILAMTALLASGQQALDKSSRAHERDAFGVSGTALLDHSDHTPIFQVYGATAIPRPRGSINKHFGFPESSHLAGVSRNVAARSNGVEGLKRESSECDSRRCPLFAVLESYRGELDSNAGNRTATSNIEVANRQALSRPEGEPPAIFMPPPVSREVDSAQWTWLCRGLTWPDYGVNDMPGRDECAVLRDEEPGTLNRIKGSRVILSDRNTNDGTDGLFDDTNGGNESIGHNVANSVHTASCAGCAPGKQDSEKDRAADELHEPSTSGNLTVPDSFHNVGISSSSLIGNCVVTDGPGTREYECETIVKPVAPLDPKRGQ
jgi:hypothetical protein